MKVKSLEDAFQIWPGISFGRVKYHKDDKFNKLTIIYRTNNDSNNHTCYVCKCDCGNFIKTTSSNLVTNHSISCGCDNGSTKRKQQKVNHKNLKNLIFDDFKVLEETNERYHGQIVWKVQCIHCGSVTTQPSYFLQDEQYCNSRKCKKCHPQEKYSGEIKIKTLLLENNILFETQKSFETCRFPDTNYPAKFDFYVNNSYLIEYDGAQHFNSCPDFWHPEKVKYRDLFKNNWCLNNNIPLIRIPYYHLKDLSLKDLQIETTKFLITK